jgi:hypothetical protein
MACYVDSVRSYPEVPFRFREFCHLLADERGELHELADHLGIPRRYFQDHPWRWHYDLPEPVRARAVDLGAREITMHDVGALLRCRRDALAVGAPDMDG